VLHETVERHETLAFIALGIFGVLLLWRIIKTGALFVRWRVFYLLLSLIGVVALGATAYYGGELVYKHGVGMPSQPWWQQ
jgi:uncharacterized membrane protein